MKKKIALFLCLLITSVLVNAQDYKWELGLNVYPNLYWKYNKLEFNMDGIKAVAPDYPNGIAFGVTVQRRLNDSWGFATGIEYSKQSQKFISPREDFNQFSTLNIEYVALPLKVVFSLPLGQTGDWSLFTQQGVRISYLANYSSILKTFQPNGDLFSVLKHSYGGIIQYQSDINDDYYSDGETAYKYFVLGYTGSLGVKRKISDNVNIFVDVRLDYDLTNSDNVDGQYNRTTNGILYYNDRYSMENKPASHNIRIGLEVGFSYALD